MDGDEDLCEGATRMILAVAHCALSAHRKVNAIDPRKAILTEVVVVDPFGFRCADRRKIIITTSRCWLAAQAE